MIKKTVIIFILLYFSLVKVSFSQEIDTDMANIAFKCERIVPKNDEYDTDYIGIVNEFGKPNFILAYDIEEKAFTFIKNTTVFLENVKDDKYALEDLYFWFEPLSSPIIFSNIFYKNKNDELFWLQNVFGYSNSKFDSWKKLITETEISTKEDIKKFQKKLHEFTLEYFETISLHENFGQPVSATKLMKLKKKKGSELYSCEKIK